MSGSSLKKWDDDPSWLSFFFFRDAETSKALSICNIGWHIRRKRTFFGGMGQHCPHLWNYNMSEDLFTSIYSNKTIIYSHPSTRFSRVPSGCPGLKSWGVPKSWQLAGKFCAYASHIYENRRTIRIRMVHVYVIYIYILYEYIHKLLCKVYIHIQYIYIYIQYIYIHYAKYISTIYILNKVYIYILHYIYTYTIYSIILYIHYI